MSMLIVEGLMRLIRNDMTCEFSLCENYSYIQLARGMHPEFDACIDDNGNEADENGDGGLIELYPVVFN